MNKSHSTITRALTTLLLVIAPMMWAQETNPKFSLTTRMFLSEQQEQSEQPANAPQRPTGMRHKQHQSLIARPDTIGNTVYIACFIHLADPTNLSELEAIGVQILSTFPNLDFVTARVPVTQLDALAAIDNVTKIKVARQMQPTTDVARQLTNVDDLLTLSQDATNLGITTKYDGTGVILGIVDVGIDFQHIAFKDKDGNSRIKRAYVYSGNGNGQEYTTTAAISNLTTDTDDEDHGTHTASTAGGSSVIVNKINDNNFTVTVTDDHANATYGGMAPAAELYLAGIQDLNDAELANSFQKIAEYADEQNKPLILSNSWGAGWTSRNGISDLSELIAQHFGDAHPNHIILFASSNDAGRSGTETGGLFVRKTDATEAEPLATIIHTLADRGDEYENYLFHAWTNTNTRPNCKMYVINNNTGAVVASWTCTANKTTSFNGLDNYYDGTLKVLIEQEGDKYHVTAITGNYGLSIVDHNYGAYSLAIEVYPESGSDEIRMWGGAASYFTSAGLTTPGHAWMDGTDDMSVSDEATIPEVISIGAYVSREQHTDSRGLSHTNFGGTLGDIAYYSCYSTPELAPFGEALPCITAPGSVVIAAVNHFHTTDVDIYSYFNNLPNLVVNNASNPYGAMQGTSMATPVAAGIVAQWLQAANSLGKTLSTTEVKTIMAETAIKDSYCTTGPNASHFGNGKINALAGIHYILENYGGGVTPQPVIPFIGSGNYGLVTSASSLAANDKILLAYTDGDAPVVLSTTQAKNNRPATTDVTLNTDGTLTPGSNAQIITLEKIGSYFLFNVGDGYLYAASSSGNQLKTKATADANAEASISINGGDATIEFQGSNTRNNLRYNENNGSPIFACYASSSSVNTLPQIYRELPIPTVYLNNDGTGNAEAIAANNGKRVTAVLSNRILFKDNSWNTLCLPFALSDLTGTPLQGATVKTLSQAAYDDNTGTLTLTFSEPLNAIEAGKPYLVKWPADADITNPVFPDVTISSTANNIQTTYIDFIGCMTPVVLAANDNTRLFLSTDNQLYWPDTDVTVGACRAYFALKGITAGQPAAGAPELRIVLNLDGEDNATDLSTINCQLSTVKFLENGHLYILRDGITYDALGRKITY